jgi:hypothetical protein
MKQVVCMKWGTAYSADYVNRLYSMVARNVTGPLRFVCYTDDPRGVRDDVACLPCPEIDLPSPQRNKGWRKVNLWAERLAGFDGGDVLFLDLDLVITGNIDCFFTWGDDYCVMRNWSEPHKRIGNTSVYRFRIGSHPYVLSHLLENQDTLLKKFRNSQTYISHTIRTMSFWPDDWVKSFKVHCVPAGLKRLFVEPRLPPESKIVVFPGLPKPHHAAVGTWPAPIHKRIYKRIRPSSWVQQNWR